MLMQLPPSGLVLSARRWVHGRHLSHCQTLEFIRKNAANFLSLSNLIMGLTSLLCTLNGFRQSACWLLLIGFMLDLADGAVARQLNACSALGAKLDDFADFTSFGLATALLLHTDSVLDALLVIVYVLAVFTRLCFYSSGIPFVYRGLPCPYASAILACASLLTSGHLVALRAIAVIMILFMADQGFYPHDKILESQLWKKVVFVGGVLIILCSFSPLACLYHLTWSVSYILFPNTLWSFKV
ncbi:transmembrane protein 269 isoform X2 [Spea bombifrons]|uniref:transmembrane protein 269 isoform X2 n=1 Tax=Spea bombifrons TaxID=233779 RepID=UPI00234A0C8E|nr:transmembrane protein 269 isoform X2 [Spea bombifrons]XP_053307903.1 transmembrane protein 269 isoform X2 [Spea bombifrons]